VKYRRTRSFHPSLSLSHVHFHGSFRELAENFGPRRAWRRRAVRSEGDRFSFATFFFPLGSKNEGAFLPASVCERGSGDGGTTAACRRPPAPPIAVPKQTLTRTGERRMAQLSLAGSLERARGAREGEGRERADSISLARKRAGASPSPSPSRTTTTTTALQMETEKRLRWKEKERRRGERGANRRERGARKERDNANFCRRAGAFVGREGVVV